MSDLKTYWPQITAVLIFTFALGGSYFQMDALADDGKKHEERIVAQEKEIQEINEKLVAMEKDSQYIQEDVGEIKTDIKAILKAVKE